MQAKTLSIFRLQYLDTTGVSEVVSAPMPMIGNTILMALNLYNVGGNATTTTTQVTLEGSVQGQLWETIGSFSAAAWGASTSSALVVTYSMVRVRVNVSVSGGGPQGKVWFDVGICFTKQ